MEALEAINKKLYMKEMLILKASEDVKDAEIDNIVSQAKMYDIKSYIFSIDSYQKLYDTLFTPQKYDYIYLATHGCETSWGNISGTVDISWLNFAAMICGSYVAKEGAIVFHSCCGGGLNQVAWQMFACCPRIEFVCGPRHDLYPVDLITAFNLFLYFIEIKSIDPVRAAEKVLTATDVRLVCYDRLETCIDYSYTSHCEIIKEDIDASFQKVVEHEIKRFGEPKRYDFQD